MDGEIHKSDLRQSYLGAFKSPGVPKMKGSIVKYWRRSGGVIEILRNERYFFIGPKHSGHAALTQQLFTLGSMLSEAAVNSRRRFYYLRCIFLSAMLI